LIFYSTTNAGKTLSVAHHDLMGDIEMNLLIVNPNVNVVSCVWSWKIDQLFRTKQFASHTKIIDLEMISD
jgi:N-acetyl-gamma-glutamyl-phosphate reductase